MTDTSGQASVQYIAGALTTANNGVQIRAIVQGTPSVFGVAQLTVNQSALFIALGTGNTISNLDPQTYKKDWTVYVTDSNGVAVPNINLTIKVLPTDYRKGNLVFTGGSWVYDTPSLYSVRTKMRITTASSILPVGRFQWKWAGLSQVRYFGDNRSNHYRSSDGDRED